YGYCYLGQVLRQSSREPEASEMSRKALALFERIDEQRLADWYDITCIRCLASELVRSGATGPADVERSRRWADRAMEALQRAVDGGYRDFAYIESDTDLDALRSRDDYKALIASLKTRVGSSANPAGTAASR